MQTVLKTLQFCLNKLLLLGRLTSVGKALYFTHEISFLYFLNQYPALSSRAEDSHQMYLR